MGITGSLFLVVGIGSGCLIRAAGLATLHARVPLLYAGRAAWIFYMRDAE
jgi:hypothetical protein